MSLFNSFDRTRHLNELLEPLETQGSGVLTPAQRQALTLANLTGGVAMSAAQFAVLGGVTPGTAAANKALVLGASKEIATITSATITTLTATTVNTATLAASGAVSSSSATAGVGYATGAGGAVTQATDKSTAVVLNKATGAITMNNAALGAATIVTFVLTNSALAATDQIVVTHESGGTTGSYTVNGRVTGAGAGAVDVRNNTAGSLSEALVLRFSIVKSVNA